MTDTTLPLVALGIAVAVLAIVSALALTRARSAERRIAALTRGEDGGSLERVLSNHLERVISLGLDVDELAKRTAAVEAGGRQSIRRIGLVRYNPFDDVGSDQSFSLALLDDEEDGVIVTSLHTRGQTRIYAKAVVAGKAEATLSEEEEAAVATARDATLGRGALRERADAAEKVRKATRSGERIGA